jgi:hypothetical protein
MGGISQPLGIGQNQSWIDVAAGRLLNVNYTNTARSILVSVSCIGLAGAAFQVSAIVNGVTVAIFGDDAGYNTAYVLEVPANAVYAFNTASGVPVISQWKELR